MAHLESRARPAVDLSYLFSELSIGRREPRRVPRGQPPFAPGKCGAGFSVLPDRVACRSACFPDKLRQPVSIRSGRDIRSSSSAERGRELRLSAFHAPGSFVRPLFIVLLCCFSEGPLALARLSAFRHLLYLRGCRQRSCVDALSRLPGISLDSCERP